MILIVWLSFTGSMSCVTLQVKIAYINFLNHCYVDTEVEMKEIYTSNHMWKLFENFLVDICRVNFQYPNNSDFSHVHSSAMCHNIRYVSTEIQCVTKHTSG